jgi:putative DNA primase/helicase
MTMLETVPGERRRIIESQEIEQSPEGSDDALALAMATKYANELRYVPAWGKWYVYGGGLWNRDDILRAWQCAKKVCRKAAADCRDNSGQTSKKIASAATIAAVERLARSDDRLVATVNQWDADPWVLNTPGGVIDLRTGDMRAHRVIDYCTKITSVAPGGDCPRFREFLKEITGGDNELEQFIGRMFGYALTGVTREHALFFCYGKGANGKSVLLGTISNLLGPYAQTAGIETFTASNSDRHPTDLAGLQGSRIVTATETEEGRQWAEARIKALTGGDKVSARFMRQDFFEYVPQFKLVIAGNHRPGLKAVDEAIRRRFHLVPFAVTIPKEKRDPNLTEKLKAEWPGILRWAIDGCLDWQAQGLNPPPAVTKATDAYLESEDALFNWLSERCLTSDPDAWEASSALFFDWQEWAKRSGEPARTQKRLSNDLEARGFRPHRRSNGRGFYGLQLVPQMTGWRE